MFCNKKLTRSYQKKRKKKKFDLLSIISYTSDVVMFSIVAIWFVAIIFSAVIVWNNPEQLVNFTDLVKVPVEFTVGGYFGRIALTHFMTINKTGHSVKKDIEVAGDLRENIGDDIKSEAKDDTGDSKSSSDEAEG